MIDTIEATREALQDYTVAASGLDVAYQGLANQKETLAYIRLDLKAAEAEVVVNGGYEEWAITGANKEARDAATTVALAHCPPYQKAIIRINDLERSIAEYEAHIERFTNEMRRCRLQIEFATSWNYRVAAAEGRAPEFKRSTLK